MRNRISSLQAVCKVLGAKKTSKTEHSEVQTELLNIEERAMCRVQGLSHLCVQRVISTPRTMFLTVIWTAKSLGQDLLMMTILEDSAFMKCHS